MKKTKRIGWACVGSLLLSQMVWGSNPILKETDPGFIYACDPSAEVFDGKVYLYCSHDQPDAVNYESMKDYAILESSDLKTWVNHGVKLDPQLDPGFEYAFSNMNAPDAAYKDGWYYWYFPSDVTQVGVAKSRTPVGPWESAVTNEITTIFDPTVFVDDDGQAYIYGNDHWVDTGEKGSHILGAKLKDNMIELDGPLIRLSEEEVDEAVHIFKRNGIYYFSARVGPITKYWMADSPLPQYAELKGELCPNSPSSPNHTSAIEFKGEWYLFYHRGDVNHGSNCRRSACFDKMTFRKDGTIVPVVYTLDAEISFAPKGKRGGGVGARVPTTVQPTVQDDGSLRMGAEVLSEQSGTTVIDLKDGEKAKGIGKISNGDWTSYTDLNFGQSPNPFTFHVRVAAPKAGGSIVIRVNSPNGIIIGTIPVPATGGWDTYETLSTTLNKVRGIQTLYLCYTGGEGDLMNVNWFGWTPAPEKRRRGK
jgi:hypothetical protein